MKTLFPFLFLLAFACPENSSAQNGVTVIPMPGFFNPISLRHKNCMAVDNSGRNWIGTRDVGLLGWDGVAWVYYDATVGLTDNNVRSLYQDPNGLLWAGTDTGGVCIFNGASWGNYSRWNSPLPSNRILAIAQQGSDMWLGTDRGLVKFDGVNWTVFNTQNSGLPSDTLNQIAFSASGEILAATPRGLIRFDGTNWSGLWYGATHSVECVYVHSDGSEWAISNGELWKKTGTSYTLASQIFDASGVFFTGIKCLTKGPSGGIAFGTKLAQLNEILGTRVKTYYPYGLISTPTTSNSLFAASQNGNYFSLVNIYVSSSSPYIDLFEFDSANYNGLGKGNTGDNMKTLDVNNVAAGILVRGDMHWDLSAAKYHVPKTSNVCTAFCSALWVGGLDTGGILHEAAMTYRQRGIDYFPGPLDAQTGLTDSTTAYKFDRIWKTDQYQISEFQFQFSQGNVQNGTYIPPNDILDWPAIGNLGIAQPLAPFVDVNGNGIYDPLVGGDYPKITGDQEVYWVFNDKLSTHTETGGNPVGVEVQAHAYAYTCPTASTSDRALNLTTFYTFDIINRSANDYHDFSTGYFQDIDLGFYMDDYVGCNPSNNFGFCYNGDSSDVGSITFPGYNSYPPIQSTVVLDGSLAVPNDSIDNDNDGVTDEVGEKNLMTGFIFFKLGNTSAIGSPSEPTDYYGYLNTLWKDSTGMTYGGIGYGGNTRTRFMYPALPDDNLGWNEFTAGDSPNDRSHLISSGNCDFHSGDTIHFTVALITSFDSSDSWNSHAYYQDAIHDVQQVQQWYTNNSAPSCFPLFDAVHALTTTSTPLLLYPNPTNDKLNIQYEAKNKNAVIEIYDIAGKRMYAGMWNDIHAMTIPVDNYAPGIYLVRMTDGTQIVSQKFIKQ